MFYNKRLESLQGIASRSPWPLLVILLGATLVYSALALRAVQPVGDAVLTRIQDRQQPTLSVLAKADHRP